MALTDLYAMGTAIQRTMLEGLSGKIYLEDIDYRQFYKFPEPGERNPYSSKSVFIDLEPYDDGGGAAIAAYQYGHCAFEP